MLKLGIIVMVISAVSAQQEGQKFLIVFPPNYILQPSGLCQIVMNANAKAEVSIHYKNITDQLTVDVGSYIHNISCGNYGLIGYGDDGILVESDVDIAVHVYTMFGSVGDAYLAMPIKNQEAEYILTSTDKPCEDGLINNFFIVAAEQNDTMVDVYAPAPGGYTFLDTIRIQRLGTYTNGSASGTLDYTGWKLQSTSPISVVSGSACSKVHIDLCNVVNAEYIFSPSTEQAGHQFIVPKVTKRNPGDSGAYIRVISFTQSNIIQLPDQSIQETLHSGQYFQYYINPYDDITRIECRDACLVVLYNELKCWSGEGGFMFYVTPLDRGTDYVRFTAIERTAGADPYLTNYITVIAQTNQVVLDGSPITGWREISGWNYLDVALQVDHGDHTLASGDGGKFVAFVYGHIESGNSGAWGYGTEIVNIG